MIVSKCFSPNPIVCEPGQSIAAAAALMRDSHVGALVAVVGGKPVGILTDRDIVIGVVAKGRDPALVRVDDVMTKNPLLARTSDDLFAVTGRFAANGVRQLPVVDGDGLLQGVIALDDALRVFAAALADVARTPGSERSDEALARGVEAGAPLGNPWPHRIS